MFIKNITKKDIKLSSFEGYKFNIPSGISWIWDEAGRHLIQNIYKPNVGPKTDKFGLDNGHGVPALAEANKKEWEKDGKKLVHVERFIINHEQIPRKKLITVAKQRGVDDGRITEWLADEQIDASVITQAINELPVPDEIRYPNEEENMLNEQTK